jgi:hypothetical protein
MALGVMTVVEKANGDGASFIDVVTFAGDNSYPTGGSAFEAAFEAKVGHDRQIMAAFGYGGDNTVEFVPAAGVGKLKVRAANGAEVANATDLSASTFRVTVLSR